MRTIRFAGAFWLLYTTFALRHPFTLPELRSLVDALPLLAAAALTLEVLPAVVGAASIVRWLRARPSERRLAFAAATRCAALLAVAGTVLLPFHAADAANPVGALARRLGQALALVLMLDGPLAPEE
jgi:hypothetical protein